MICGNQPPSPREIRETRFGQTYPRERFDSTTLNGDDEGGSRSRPAAQSKAGVVGGHEQTDGYYAADVEKQDAYVHAANSPREIASRVLRFPGGNLENSSGLQPSIVISSRRERDHTHRDDLSADEREGSLGQNGPEAEKTPLRAGDAVVLRERSRVFPIAEPDAIVIGTSTEIEDDSQNYQAGDSDNLN